VRITEDYVFVRCLLLWIGNGCERTWLGGFIKAKASPSILLSE
jgi:hypothetical protein